MENRIQSLKEEIEQIRTQYIQEIGAGGRKVWPRSIKERVLELIGLVGSVKRTADLVGISAETLYQWNSGGTKNKFKQLSVIGQKTVTVTDTNLAKKNSGVSSNLNLVTVMVTTPNGFRIEGLSLELAIEFLMKMGIK